MTDTLLGEDRYQSVEEALARHSSIGDRMTEETLVAQSNPTYESFPMMSQHHHLEIEYQNNQDMHDIQLDPVEYLDPMRMDVSMKEGSTNYKH